LDGDLGVSKEALLGLPPALRPLALAVLHRWSGAPYPPGTAAAAELLRQLGSARRVGCDAGGGWRWESRRGLLLLHASAPRARAFSYTLDVPGEVTIPEAGCRLRIRRGPVMPWMFRAWPRRVGLLLPVEQGSDVEVRSRRPGDRLQPLGHSRSRRLKEVLIDAGVARRERDRLPLLCVGGRIAWVPGVAVAESCRLAPAGMAWIAELLPDAREQPARPSVGECRNLAGGLGL
jgi:tRNA(Ile)-lysidine synthetase-like protein